MDFGELIDEVIDTPESQYGYEVIVPMDIDDGVEMVAVKGLRYDHTEKRVIIET